jgi:hypothetical protein
MNGSFYLYPAPGKFFDVQSIRSKLLSYSGVIEVPGNDHEFVIAVGNQASIVRERAMNGNPPEWTVLVNLQPDSIYVWRQASRETLDYFATILKYLLAQGVAKIKDEEDKDVPVTAPEALLGRLLA